MLSEKNPYFCGFFNQHIGKTMFESCILPIMPKNLRKASRKATVSFIFFVFKAQVIAVSQKNMVQSKR